MAALETVMDNSDTRTDLVMEEDKRLVERHLAGDPEAFDALVTRYRRQVYAVAYRFTHHPQEADDLAQETFIRAYQNLNTFRGDASFKTWLLRITTNLSINVTKSSRIAKDSGKEPMQHATTASHAPIDRLIEDQQKQTLRRAIRRLPPKQKATLMLKTFQELTCAEVARLMKCSEGTVKANLFNALKRLRSLLAEDTPDGP